jgi:DNA-binding helix-turn-helix protein|nr:MAG TPA: helix-turn-helix domain protein [Caudoviricetes sp.]
MQQSAQNNLFTTFNNIEKIKKSKEERMLKPVIRVEEMIRTIKEHYNLNSSMLANNLGVDAQTVYKWEKGDNKPSMKYYNKIKEFYEGIVKEDKEEAIEQPEIANKEVEEDVTVGTPFICLTFAKSDTQKTFVNINEINEIVPGFDGITIHTTNGEFTNVKETPAEILDLIRKKLKENEKN